MLDLLTGEIAKGDGIGVADAAGRFPPARSGRPCHPATVTRWIIKGSRSGDGRVVRLEGKRVGGRWVTSEKAIGRFIDRLQAPADATDVPVGPSDRLTRVEQELTELGV